MNQPSSEYFIQPAAPNEVGPNWQDLAILPGPTRPEEQMAYMSKYVDGQKAGMLLVTSALAGENVVMSTELEQQRKHAVTDELTGQPNRRGLILKLEGQIAKAPGKVGVLFVDLDGLKETNDGVGGHAAGDALIIGGASALAAGLGENHTRGHMAARQSGDELVGIVEDVSTEEELELVGAAVRKSFEEAGIPASLGIALHRPGETAADVIKRADQAMYLIKQNRKDHREEARAETEFNSLPQGLQDHYAEVARLLFEGHPGSDIDQFIRIVRFRGR